MTKPAAEIHYGPEIHFADWAPPRPGSTISVCRLCEEEKVVKKEKG